MSDDPGPDTKICWLGAFAMGLAVSSQSADDCVEELIEASSGDAAALAAARRRVIDLDIGDELTRAIAVALLERAVGALDGTAPVLVEAGDRRG